MKNLLRIFLGFILTSFAISTFASEGCTKGQGDLVSKTISIDNFSKIKIDGSIDVVIGYGSSQKVEVEGQANIIDLLSRTVTNNEWKVTYNESVCLSKSFTVFVTVPEMSSVKINGSGDVTCESMFNEGSFDIDINGSGDVQYTVNAKQVKVNIHGSGDVKLEGKANDLSIHIHGSGDVAAYDFKAVNANVEIEGSGDVDVNVSKSLRASIYGSGDISYEGDPAEVNVEENGSGSVLKR